jgi:16S rRNA processing protein RimM
MSGPITRQKGPSKAGGPTFIVVGKVRRPHGLHGEMVVELHTDFPERLSPKRVVFIGNKHVKMIISSQRPHFEGMLLGFNEITSPEAAGRFRNQTISISSSDLYNLPPGKYYFHQLQGLEAMDEDGNLLGTVIEILETGANDVYVVKDITGRELLLPATPEVVKSVNLENKTMVVHVIPGLLE